MSDVYRCMIVPAAVVEQARGFAILASPEHGQGMWTTGLSASGNAPATHYVSAGYIGPEWALSMPCKTWELQDGQWAVSAELAGDAQGIAGSLQAPPEQVQALLGAVDISDQEIWGAMGRMGLQLVQNDSP